jgi:hypothetical protein
MTKRTRRDFLRQSILAVPGSVSLAALLANRVHAANNTSAAPVDLQLMINGAYAGYNLPGLLDIQQVAPPAAAAPDVAGMRVAAPRMLQQTQQVHFQFTGGMSSVFNNLVQQSVAHQLGRVDGVLLLGTPYALQAAYEWTGGSIYQIDLPGLDANANAPVYATATLKAVSLAPAAVSKYAAVHAQGYGVRRQLTQWTARNFKLSCSALGTLVRTMSVSSLSFSAQLRGGSFSFVMATSPALLASTLKPFSTALGSGGQLIPGQPTTFELDLLNSNMSATLASASLQNCLITHIDTSTTAGGSVVLSTVTVAFSDASMSLA